MTIGEFPSQLEDMGQEELDGYRTSAEYYMQEYFSTISKNITNNSPVFESIVRSYHVLDKKHFAIQQRISICLNKTEKGWTVVLWLDTGKPLAQNQPGPWTEWLRINQTSRPRRETFLPWIQAYPFASLHAKSLSIANDRRPAQDNTEQTSTLIHLDYGKTLDKRLMAEDPFYTLHEIFSICATSEVQFLNVLESKISTDIARELRPDRNISPANIMYFQGLLDSHAEMLRENIVSIKNQDAARWPQPNNPTLRQRSTIAMHSLLQDYEALFLRTQTLSERCKSRLNILMNRAGIVESNKAIEQTKEVTKLTRLAFIFTPLSFTSSFFGMNLGPFADNPTYGLWLFFAISVPLVALLLITMTWSLSGALMKIIAPENFRRKKSF